MSRAQGGGGGASRRRFLAQGAGAGLGLGLGLAGCGPAAAPPSRIDPAWRARVEGRWIGDDAARGHRVRDIIAARGTPPPAVREMRTDVLVVGAGIAGLAAARALARAGVEDFAVLDLEDAAGGNSRGHVMAGMGCPRGAHYLPLPGTNAGAEALREWLVEAGLAKAGPGGTLTADERDLCASPHERLFIDGHWQEGLLPAAPTASRTFAQYRRLAALVTAAARDVGFALPTASVPWTAAHAALDAQTFSQWLAAQGVDDPGLLTYLDYCCRDDYGAGAHVVSAWAGVHYFASRHGFAAPGDPGDVPDPILAWPEGNGRLVATLAAPLGLRWYAGRAVFRVDEGRDGVQALALSFGPGDDANGVVERWEAKQVVMASPLFISARVLSAPPDALSTIAPRMRHAPWLVGSLLMKHLPHDRAGAPLAWDNVIHGSPSLGYVNDQQQSLEIVVGPHLWTAYWALPEAWRARLLALPWQDACALFLQDLSAVHPDLPDLLQRADFVRHGHAMSIPAPGVRGHPALAALWPERGRTGAAGGRVAFAHADLSAYSVFEEAFHHGDRAGALVAARLGAKRAV